MDFIRFLIHNTLCGSFICMMFEVSRQVVVSRETKKKQHAHAYSGLCDQYSELFTRMIGLKF